MLRMAKKLRLSYVLIRQYLESITKTTALSRTSDRGCISSVVSLTAARKYCSERYEDDNERKPSLKKRPVPHGGSHFSGKYRYKDQHVESLQMDQVDDILHDLHQKNLIDADWFVTNVPSPFKEEVRKCVLCKSNIELDYKNIQLLNQFISSKTGNIFERENTDLCIPMYKRVKDLINRARSFGLMPYLHGVPEFEKDQKMFKRLRKTSSTNPKTQLPS